VPKKHLGRPPEFKQRASLTVFLEVAELTKLQAKAAAAGISLSRLARSVLVAALGRKGQ